MVQLGLVAEKKNHFGQSFGQRSKKTPAFGHWPKGRKAEKAEKAEMPKYG